MSAEGFTAPLPRTSAVTTRSDGGHLQPSPGCCSCFPGSSKEYHSCPLTRKSCLVALMYLRQTVPFLNFWVKSILLVNSQDLKPKPISQVFYPYRTLGTHGVYKLGVLDYSPWLTIWGLFSQNTSLSRNNMLHKVKQMKV